MRQVFQRLDCDNSRSITWPEFAAMFTAPRVISTSETAAGTHSRAATAHLTGEQTRADQCRQPGGGEVVVSKWRRKQQLMEEKLSRVDNLSPASNFDTAALSRTVVSRDTGKILSGGSRVGVMGAPCPRCGNRIGRHDLLHCQKKWCYGVHFGGHSWGA